MGDVREVVTAKQLMIGTLAQDTQISEMGDQVLNASDENNDGKVIEEEWHDFQRSIYEVAGKRRWQELVRNWRKSFVQRVDMENEEKEEEEKEKKNKKKKTAQLTTDQAATKIQ